MTATHVWQRAALAAAGILILGALAGCAAAGPAAVTAPAPKAPAAAKAFAETAKAEDVSVKLAVEPLKVGENHFAVTVDSKDVKAVEAQIVMASMGHGQIVELTQTAPGKFEVDTAALDMEGRWMFRIQVTDGADQTKTAVFHTVVK
ncbi:MAG TPA: FixH family protein [Symbiobacteriaceae bacterium]|nr:FixH family protein [Symbiobacteriaceae bacterium]